MLATVRRATQAECAKLLEQNPAREVNALRLGLRVPMKTTTPTDRLARDGSIPDCMNWISHR